MNAANYHTFNIQIPLGLQIITPMTTSSSLLDKFSLLLATGLGTLQQSAQRKEIERALSVEPLSEVQPYELDLVLHQMAMETAQQISGDFVERLTKKLKPELPALPSLPTEQETPPVTRENLEFPALLSPSDEQETPPATQESPDEVAAPPIPVEEPMDQVSIPEPILAPPSPKTQPPSSYTIGQMVENPLLAKVVAIVGQCSNGFEFAKVEGGYQCNGGEGSHFASDKAVMKLYEKEVAKGKQK
jgi:hypothetical protein